MSPPFVISLIYEQLCDIHAELKKNNALLQSLSIKQSPEENKRFNVPEAAKYLNISQTRLRELYRSCQIDHIQDGKGCRVLFTKQGLDKWIREQEEKSRKPKDIVPEGYNAKWWDKAVK